MFTHPFFLQITGGQERNLEKVWNHYLGATWHRNKTWATRSVLCRQQTNRAEINKSKIIFWTSEKPSKIWSFCHQPICASSFCCRDTTIWIFQYGQRGRRNCAFCCSWMLLLWNWKSEEEKTICWAIFSLGFQLRVYAAMIIINNNKNKNNNKNNNMNNNINNDKLNNKTLRAKLWWCRLFGR